MPSDNQTLAYPRWFGWTALIALLVTFSGGIAGTVWPGEITGAFFPLGVFILWVLWRVSRSKWMRRTQEASE